MTVRQRETDRSYLRFWTTVNETRTDDKPFVLYIDSGEEHTVVVQRRVDVYMLYPTKRLSYTGRKEVAEVAEDLLYVEGNLCQCGSRGPGRHAAFFAPEDVQLIGHGTGLRVADLSRLKFIFINLSADLTEPSYRLTVRRAG